MTARRAIVVVAVAVDEHVRRSLLGQLKLPRLEHDRAQVAVERGGSRTFDHVVRGAGADHATSTVSAPVGTRCSRPPRESASVVTHFPKPDSRNEREGWKEVPWSWPAARLWLVRPGLWPTG